MRKGFNSYIRMTGITGGPSYFDELALKDFGPELTMAEVMERDYGNNDPHPEMQMDYGHPLIRCQYCGGYDTSLTTCPHCSGPRHWR